jgi:hypothetical protein
MSEGFLDFSFGQGDELVGKKGKRFKGEKDRSYRASFAYFDKIGADGVPAEDANPCFVGCQRIYKPGVGYILHKGPEYNQFGTPKQCIGTVIVLWPTDREGQLDTSAFKAGTGWQVLPWLLDADKYNTLKTNHRRFHLGRHDFGITCTDATFQKMTFAPEPESLLRKLLGASSENHRDLARKILDQARKLGEDLRPTMARDLSVREVMAAIAGDAGGSSDGGGKSTSGVSIDSDALDNLLED